MKNSKLREIPITTVYGREIQPPSIQFWTRVNIRITFSPSFVTHFWDDPRGYTVFIALLLGIVTAVALPIARLFAGTAVFLLSRNFVFNSNEIIVQALKYYSCYFKFGYFREYYKLFENKLGLNMLIGLFTSYIFLFSINFLMQKC